MGISKTTMVCTLSCALLAAHAVPATAAPLPTHVATMKSMAADGPSQVHWHGGWGGWGIGAGFLAGALIGGAIANSHYGYYGGPYYAYSYPQYGYYYYPPTVSYGYAPYYGYRVYRPYRVYGYRHHYWHRRYW